MRQKFVSNIISFNEIAGTLKNIADMPTNSLHVILSNSFRKEYMNAVCAKGIAMCCYEDT